MPGTPPAPKFKSLDPNSESVRQNVSNLMQMRQGVYQGNLGVARPRGPPPISPSHMNGTTTPPFGYQTTPPPLLGSNRRGPPGQGLGMSQGPGPPGSIIRGPPPRVPLPRGPPPMLPQRFSPPTAPAFGGHISNGSAINQIKSVTEGQLPPHVPRGISPPPAQGGPFTPITQRASTVNGNNDYRNDDIEREKNSKISLLVPKVENMKAQQQKVHMSPFGKMTVKIVQGKNLKAGYGALGKANPFVQIKLGSKEVSTSVHREGGKNPIWNSLFEFDITNEKEMSITILDKGPVGRDTFMGKVTINLLDWMAQGNFYGTVELLDNSGGIAGGLVVEALFHKTGQLNLDMDHHIPSQEFSDEQILEAFKSFDLDKNNYIGAAELRHILKIIGETVKDEEVS